MTTSRLTSTSLGTMRRCPRQYWFRYEVGLRRVRESAPLRLGSAHRLGQPKG